MRVRWDAKKSLVVKANKDRKTSFEEARKKRGDVMKNVEPKTAEEIACMADRGEDVTPYLGKPEKDFLAKQLDKKKRVQRVNVDFNSKFLEELDDFSDYLNVSRQSLIKMFVMEGLSNRTKKH